MSSIHSKLIVCGCLLIQALTASLAQAQATPDDAARFGPGIINLIDAAPHPDETFSGPLPMQEFLDKHPEIDWKEPDFPENKPFFNSRSRTLIEIAKQVTYRREIHGFEFAFKPMRQMYVDIPQETGVMKRKLVWYLVYRIRYRGGDLRAKKVVDPISGENTYPEIEAVAYKQRRCVPSLVLSVPSKGKEYLDRLIPVAREEIARREQITSRLHSTIELGTVSIPRTTTPDAPGIWAYAVWEDVDPNTDFFSVLVHGLTNAFQIIQGGGEEKVARKVLQLNFFRPGDTIRQLDDEIRYGIPAFDDPKEQAYVLKQYGMPERLDYRWIFR